ncbi:MAG: SagB/ThcOx family dehydrogenase [Candidatus Binatia bacterium]
MVNLNIEEAKIFHQATKHSYRSVRQSAHYLDWDNRPLLYKIYRDLPPIRLPCDFPAPAAGTLQAVSSPGCNEGKGLNLKELSQVLFYSGGLTKKKSLSGGEEYYFRAAACAGALYPIEIYVVCKDIPGLEAGVYHFNPQDFGLRRLRSGDYRPELVSTAGDNQGIAGAAATLIFSAIFWRSAWKYRARSYRHCFWDSGTILANLMAVAASEQIPWSVEMAFVDSRVNQILGLDGNKEASLCLVPLGRSLDWAGHVRRQELLPLSYEVEPLSREEVNYPVLKQMHAASCLVADEEARPWRGPCVRPQGETRYQTVPLELSLSQSRPLGEVILARGSTRRFAQEAISFAQLSTILDRSTCGIPADFLAGPETSLLDLYLIINAVDGLDPGAYYFSPSQKRLERLKAGSFRQEAGYLCLEQTLATDASAVVFFLSDLVRVLNRFGNRGYRAAQLEAGITGGKLYLSSYSLGLGATGLTFYDDDVVRFFSPHAEGKDAIFVVALGRAAKAKDRDRVC